MSLDSWAERSGDAPATATTATPATATPAPAAPATPATAHPPPSSSGSGSPAIHTVELSKRYRRTVAVRGLSMTVQRGEVFAFLGPNGAGKTTTVKLLLGLTRPTGGEALVLGAPAGDVEARRRIGYLPELFRFQHWLSAREVLDLHGRLLQLSRRERHVDEALATVGLSARGDDKVATFSKGMQQRLGLAVALLGAPALVVLDEPTSALDPVGRHHVRTIVRELRQRGTTVFLNTHLLEEAEMVCDRVTVIDHGRAIATGSLDELLGARTSVRFLVGGLPDRWWLAFESLGRWSVEDDRTAAPADRTATPVPADRMAAPAPAEQPSPNDAAAPRWVRLEGVAPDAVPEVVAAVVAQGGRVEAVVPEHQTLEERFLELLGPR